MHHVRRVTPSTSTCRKRAACHGVRSTCSVTALYPHAARFTPPPRSSRLHARAVRGALSSQQQSKTYCLSNVTASRDRHAGESWKKTDASLEGSYDDMWKLATRLNNQHSTPITALPPADNPPRPRPSIYPLDGSRADVSAQEAVIGVRNCRGVCSRYTLPSFENTAVSAI